MYGSPLRQPLLTGTRHSRGSGGDFGLANPSAGASAASALPSDAAAPPPPPKPPREPLLDNARSLLIYLVVLYHCACVYTCADRPDGSGPMAYWSGLLCLMKPVVMPGTKQKKTKKHIFLRLFPYIVPPHLSLIHI